MNRISLLPNLPWTPIIIIFAGLVTSIGFPLSIVFEFRQENLWLFYFQLYPHMIFFPCLFFGSILLSLYQAIRLVRNKRSLFRNTAVVMGFSIILLSIEITSNNMMLFEFKNTAQSTINNVSRETLETIQDIPAQIIDTREIIKGNQIIIKKSDLNKTSSNFMKQKEQLKEAQKMGYYNLMKLSLSYQTWKGKHQVFSWSRWLYAFTFFIIVSASLMTAVLFFAYSREEVQNPRQYISKLALTAILFATWTPLRFYYNLTTKHLLFGSTTAISNLDVFAFLIYPLYLGFIIWKIYQIRQDLIWTIAIAIAITFLNFIGLIKTDFIDRFLGLQSSAITWIIGILISLSFLYITSRDLRTEHE